MLYQGIDIESESQQYTLVSSVTVFSQWSHRDMFYKQLLGRLTYYHFRVFITNLPLALL